VAAVDAHDAARLLEDPDGVVARGRADPGRAVQAAGDLLDVEVVGATGLGRRRARLDVRERVGVTAAGECCEDQRESKGGAHRRAILGHPNNSAP
jgi:hypothetical protein